nr:SPX domain-containing protein 4 [Tanacetum cinerariifolium]
EVVETTSDTKTAPLPIGEGTSDVYRRTVDAINTIKGLKKESSTSNPLSFASIFGNQDIDTGAITAEDDSQSETDSGHGTVVPFSGVKERHVKIARLTTPVAVPFSLASYITASAVENGTRNRTAHHSNGGVFFVFL